MPGEDPREAGQAVSSGFVDSSAGRDPACRLPYFLAFAPPIFGSVFAGLAFSGLAHAQDRPIRAIGLSVGTVEVMQLAMFAGVMGAALLSAIFLIRERARTAAENGDLRSRVADLNAAIQRSEALLNLRDQRGSVWSSEMKKPQLGGALPPETGAPHARSACLAFGGVDDLNLYVIGADGSGLRRLTTDTAYEQLLGWSHDGAHLYFTQPGAEGQRLRILDLASGAITESAWRLGGKGISAALSPDDRQLAFIEPVPGQMGAGLYLAEAGGVERRLLAQLSHWGVSSPVWSPDGRWLLVSVTNTDLFSSRSAPALINLATCQPYALAGIEGEVFGWAP